MCVVTENKSAAMSEWAERWQCARAAECLFAPLKIHHLARARSPSLAPVFSSPSAASVMASRPFCLDFLFSDFVLRRVASHSLIFRVAGPHNFD